MNAPSRLAIESRLCATPLALACALLVAACSSDPSGDQIAYVERPVEELYNNGLDALRAGDYSLSSEEFDEVERQHPFSAWAPRAQLLSAYAHYLADNYDDAVIGLNRFIRLHPSSPDADYAYYLKALALYEQIIDVDRDQVITRQAMAALDDVIQRYPNSDYARDALLKRELTQDHLAGKEINIGRYYLRRGKVLAAVNRFQYVLANYQTTTHVPEALHRTVEAFMVLGLKDEATKTASVLGYNYPGSQWYADSYELLTGERVEVSFDPDDRGLINRTIDYLLEPLFVIGAVDSDAELIGKASATKTRNIGPNDGITRATLIPEGQAVRPDVMPDLPLLGNPTAEAPSPDENRIRLDALAAAAAEQEQSASAAADGWAEIAAATTDPQLRRQAASQQAIADASRAYWRARKSLIRQHRGAVDGRPFSEERRNDAERAVAEAGLRYWQTVAELGETATERRLAEQNAAAAAQALAYWQQTGQS